MGSRIVSMVFAAAVLGCSHEDGREVGSLEARLRQQGQALDEQLRRMRSFGQGPAFQAALASLRAEGLWARAPEGWVFRADLRYLRNFGATVQGYRDGSPPPPDQDPLACVVDLARQLRRRDIDLLFVPVPARAQVHPEDVMVLETTAGFAGMGMALTQFLRELNRQGVETLDLTPAFVEGRAPDAAGAGDGLYLRHNVHWTSRGAELAARLIADHVSRLPWYPASMTVEAPVIPVEESILSFAVSPEEQPPVPDPEPMLLRAVRPPPGALGEARQSPVLVIGDSFVGFLDWLDSSVVDHLERHLGRSVDSISNRGGGADQCRKTLRRRRDNLQGKRILVWVLAASALRPGPGWKPIPVFEE